MCCPVTLKNLSLKKKESSDPSKIKMYQQAGPSCISFPQIRLYYCMLCSSLLKTQDYCLCLEQRNPIYIFLNLSELPPWCDLGHGACLRSMHYKSSVYDVNIVMVVSLLLV